MRNRWLKVNGFDEQQQCLRMLADDGCKSRIELARVAHLHRANGQAYRGRRHPSLLEPRAHAHVVRIPENGHGVGGFGKHLLKHLNSFLAQLRRHH